MKNKYLLAALGLFSLLNTSFASFTDSAEIPSWAVEPIHALSYLEVIAGNPDGTIKPLETINRAEFCKIIIEATKTPLVYPDTASFPDVTKDDWFYPYVEAAKAKGWLTGYPDGFFKPGQTINRAEVAKILTQAFEFPTSNFPGSEWFYPYFESLRIQDLLANGSSFDNLAPETNATRAEIFEQIYKAMAKKEFFEPENIPTLLNESAQSTKPIHDTGSVVTNTTTLSSSSTSSGQLQIEKISDNRRINTIPGAFANIEALSLNIRSQNAPVTVSALQVRRIGNGSYSDFEKVFVEVNGKKSSLEITPNDDVIIIPLLSDVVINTGNTVTFTIKTSVSSTAKNETSSRFTLFLPEWIEANTTIKNGFFPFGGVNIDIQ